MNECLTQLLIFSNPRKNILYSYLLKIKSIVKQSKQFCHIQWKSMLCLHNEYKIIVHLNMIIADLVIIININNNIKKTLKWITHIRIVNYFFKDNSLIRKPWSWNFVSTYNLIAKRRMDQVNPLKLCKKKCNAVWWESRI